MEVTTFFKGMGLGLIAGAAAEMVITGTSARKTTVGKTMQKVENSVDAAINQFQK